MIATIRPAMAAPAIEVLREPVGVGRVAMEALPLAADRALKARISSSSVARMDAHFFSLLSFSSVSGMTSDALRRAVDEVQHQDQRARHQGSEHTGGTRCSRPAGVPLDRRTSRRCNHHQPGYATTTRVPYAEAQLHKRGTLHPPISYT